MEKDMIINFLNLEEVDEISIAQLYEDIENRISSPEGEGVIVPPGSHNDARNWVYAYHNIEAEISRLKGEYIPFLTKRYIEPVKEKIEKHTNALEMIASGLKEFLENIEETKVNFPDLSTIYMSKVADKIIYPENEDEFIENLLKENSEYINTSYSLNKKKIKEDYSKNNKLPIEGLEVKKSDPEIRFRKVK